MVKLIVSFILLSIVTIFLILLVRTLMVAPNWRVREQKTSVSVRINFNQENAVKHLSQAVTHKTISTPDDNKTNAESFSEFHAFLRETYPLVFQKLTVKKMGAFGLLLMWKGSSEKIKPILLMAHQDVVPIAIGTEDQWEHEPFSGVIDKDFIWGRGTIDDKGSLISIFESVELLLNEGFTPERSIYFYFGDNEEIGGASAKLTGDYLQENNVHFEFALDEGGAIAVGLISQIEEPIAFISVAEKGFIDLELSTTAKGGHSSMPPEHTAIGDISAAINKLEKNQFPKHFGALQQQILTELSPQLNFSTRLITNNMWLFKPFLFLTPTKSVFSNAMLRTTTAPTIFNAGVKSNVLPAEAKAVINFRILPGDTTQTVQTRVIETIGNEKIAIAQLIGWNPSPVSRTSTRAYQTIKDLIHQVVSPDLLVAPYLTVGATDSRHFAKVSDDQYRFLCVHFDKLDFARYHGTNERITKKNLAQMMQFYYLLMKQS